MQRLALADHLFPALLAGEKRQTIRWREGKIEPGALLFFSDSDPQLRVEVQATRCTSMPLAAVAAFLGKTEEWPDAEMLSGMRRHYPTITLADEVDVVEHLPPAESAGRLGRR